METAANKSHSRVLFISLLPCRAARRPEPDDARYIVDIQIRDGGIGGSIYGVNSPVSHLLVSASTASSGTRPIEIKLVKHPNEDRELLPVRYAAVYANRLILELVGQCAHTFGC